MPQPAEEEDDEAFGEGEGEGEDDDKMLIDIDDLDEENKAMLLQYLQNEYEKNPDQFPFPQELINQYLPQQSQQQQEQDESLKDIKSEEMVVEDFQKNPDEAEEEENV